jgi:hypothetical protein
MCVCTQNANGSNATSHVDPENLASNVCIASISETDDAEYDRSRTAEPAEPNSIFSTDERAMSEGISVKNLLLGWLAIAPSYFSPNEFPRMLMLAIDVGERPIRQLRANLWCVHNGCRRSEETHSETSVSTIIIGLKCQ